MKKFALIAVLLVTISLLCCAEQDGSEVVKAQRYQKRTRGQNYSCAVVLTLKNDERWFIRKLPSWGSNGNVVIDSKIPKKYRLFATKNVTDATIIEYIRAAGKKYNFLTDNSNDACDRMMAIV